MGDDGDVIRSVRRSATTAAPSSDPSSNSSHGAPVAVVDPGSSSRGWARSSTPTTGHRTSRRRPVPSRPDRPGAPASASSTQYAAARTGTPGRCTRRGPLAVRNPAQSTATPASHSRPDAQQRTPWSSPRSPGCGSSSEPAASADLSGWRAMSLPGLPRTHLDERRGPAPRARRQTLCPAHRAAQVVDPVAEGSVALVAVIQSPVTLET